MDVLVTLRRLVRMWIVWVAVLVAACETTSPTAPSPAVQVAGPGFVTPLSCPADVEVISDSGSMAVTFPQPTIDGAGQVTKSSCEPASGSTFPIGTSPVTCTATEAEALIGSCTFAVTVLPPGLLSKTKFMAFGDSLTKGVVGLTPSDLVDPANSYPTQLQDMLGARYPDQIITVINAGKGGENTSGGRVRAPQELNEHAPEVLMILEGVNDLVVIGPSQAAMDLKVIAQLGKMHGAAVLIATLTPIGDRKNRQSPGLRAAIDDLNQQIRQIARELNIDPVVDLFAAFEGNPSLLCDDGLHPTVEGYRVMAMEFFDGIVSRFEVSRARSNVSGRSLLSTSASNR